MGWNSKNWATNNTCFYYTKYINFYGIPKILGGIARDAVRYAPFVPILLLAFSRFLGIYFPMFYKAIFSKNYKTIAFILFFDLIFLFLIGFRRIIIVLGESLAIAEMVRCKAEFCGAYNSIYNSPCMELNENFFRCFNGATVIQAYWLRFSRNIPTAFSPAMFSLAIIFAVLLFGKICIQLKYQLKHNQSFFISTIKIASVIFFQCCTMSVVFVITLIQLILQEKVFASLDYGIYDYRFIKEAPPWIFFLQYNTTAVSFNIIRVFLDSVIVLTLLGGYSACVLSTLKFIPLCFTNPRKAIKKFKDHFSTNRSQTFMISSSNKVISKL